MGAGIVGTPFGVMNFLIIGALLSVVHKSVSSVYRAQLFGVFRVGQQTNLLENSSN